MSFIVILVSNTLFPLLILSALLLNPLLSKRYISFQLFLIDKFSKVFFFFQKEGGIGYCRVYRKDLRRRRNLPFIYTHIYLLFFKHDPLMMLTCEDLSMPCKVAPS